MQQIHDKHQHSENLQKKWTTENSLNCIQNVFFIQYPVCTLEGQVTIVQANHNHFKSLSIMKTATTQQKNISLQTLVEGKCDSLECWDSMDGFHNLKLQSSPHIK